MLTETSLCKTISFFVHSTPSNAARSSGLTDPPLRRISRAVEEWHASITWSYSSIRPVAVHSRILDEVGSVDRGSSTTSPLLLPLLDPRSSALLADDVDQVVLIDTTGSDSRSAPCGSASVTRLTYSILMRRQQASNIHRANEQTFRL